MNTRYLSPDPAVRSVALALYETVAGLPLICPHGHVDPRVFANPDSISVFGTPADLFIIPDHYVVRMLYSQGVPMSALLPSLLGEGQGVGLDHRAIWQTFADHIHLFRGTPTGMWIRDELRDIFGIHDKLTPANAQSIYDRIAEQLTRPEFRPRALYERFNIEVLTTTDAATDTLEHHQRIRSDVEASRWHGRILPTFRPDGVVNLDAPNWRYNIDTLSEVTSGSITNYQLLITALQSRRAFFKSLGATATDHAALTPFTERLSDAEADAIFQRALQGQATSADAQRFTGHMLMEMARMSCDDGLVMQLHVGSLRNHNRNVFEQFGADKGADIPIAADFTRNLQPLLNEFGNDPRFSLILFTLDETTYARELAPLAGHYPAVKLGPPWWFYDSLNGMRHYFDQVMETAGIYNTVGFNDDTRAFCSIPARHDLWRRATCDWLAGLVVQHIVDEDDARDMAHDLAYGLAKRAYKL